MYINYIYKLESVLNYNPAIMAHAGVWILTSVTFILAIYALIDQSALRRDLSAQVFRVVDGTATVASTVDKVILSPEKPSDEEINALPKGAVYIGAKLRFSTGHVMDRDPRGNLILSSVKDGVETRMATFSPHGAVGFGQVPLTPTQEKSRNLFLTGTPSDVTRDGWMSSGTTAITDANGNTVGSLSNVVLLEDTTITGVQIYSQTAKQSITFSADGRVIVGNVRAGILNSNNQASLLVNGDTVVDTTERTINYKCMDVETFKPQSDSPHLSVQTSTTLEYIDFKNGLEERLKNVAYFNHSKCYSVSSLPFLSYNPDFENLQHSYVKSIPFQTCVDKKNFAYLYAYSDSDCTNDETQYQIELNSPREAGGSGIYHIYRCWKPKNMDIPDVQSQYEPS
jgi:hypothetical protein